MEYLPIVLMIMLLPSVIGFVFFAEMMMAYEIDELNKLNGWDEQGLYRIETYPELNNEYK